MKIKVCGMKDPANINDVLTLKPDYVGFIFYKQSPRYAGGNADISKPLDGVNKTGVFVNEEIAEVEKQITAFHLTAVQLHGEESPEYCSRLRNNGVQVIKAFSISSEADIRQTIRYSTACDYFLFDTKTPAYGGSGKKFDWQLLEAYEGDVPFFLSGGIAPEDAGEIKNMLHPRLAGLDLNSRFETSPAYKDIAQLKKFINEIRK